MHAHLLILNIIIWLHGYLKAFSDTAIFKSCKSFFRRLAAKGDSMRCQEMGNFYGTRYRKNDFIQVIGHECTIF
jgi:hypothetical protein